MKQRIVSIFLVMVSLCSLSVVAWANDTEDGEVIPYSSDYIHGAEISFKARGNGRMAIIASVTAVDIADVVGIEEIYIEYLVNNKWKYYDTMYSGDYPEFYDYNSVDYLKTIYFNGVPGDTYRVTVTFSAKIGSGADTLVLTSRSAKCQ